MYPQAPEAGAHQSEPVHAGAHTFEQEWLTVEQAVVRCAELGLTRTPKTIRKWAERSSGLSDGDVVARKEDTPWGYRWLVESASLTRKVEEEIELRGTNQTEPVRTASHPFPSRESEKPFVARDGQGIHTSAPVQSSAHTSAPSEPEIVQQKSDEPGAHHPEPVQTRSDMEMVLDEVRDRMGDKDREISFLREQLAEAQAEVKRRAASTDEALKTIDRVVRSFEMQAEANKALALRGATPPEPERSEGTVRFTPDSVDINSRHQDIRRI